MRWILPVLLVLLILAPVSAQEEKQDESQDAAVEVQTPSGSTPPPESEPAANAAEKQAPPAAAAGAPQAAPDSGPVAVPPAVPPADQNAAPGNVAESAGAVPHQLPPGILVPPGTQAGPAASPGTPGAQPLVGPLPPKPLAPPLPDGAVAPSTPEPAPDDGGGFSEEELKELGFPSKEPSLPDIAEGQSTFIPDTSPSDLFVREDGKAEPPPFETNLGSSRLPGDDVETLVQRYDLAPEFQIDPGFARIVVPTGTITGSTESKQFHIEGGLKMYYSQVTISGTTADIDEKNEVAVIKGSVSIDDPKYSLKTDELRISFKDKQFQALGFVEFRKEPDEKKSQPNLSLPKKERLREYFAGQKFELYCGKLAYGWETKMLTAMDDVRLVHPSFSGSMDRLDYNDQTKQYEMFGALELDVSGYDWIFANKLAEESDEKKLKALTDAMTKIICDRLLYSEDTAVAEFYAAPGRTVSFQQPKRSITANYIEVNDKTKDFYAEGAADKQVNYTQTDGQWLFDGGLVKQDQVAEDLRKALMEQLSVTADTLTYNFDRKRFELRGTVTIRGATRSLSAGEIVQDETAKFFLMRDNVVIKPDDKSEIYAAQVYVDTANDVFTFVGLVQGKSQSDELPSAGEATAGAAGAGAAGAPQIAPGVFQQQGNLPGSPNRQTSGEQDDEGQANVAER